MINFHVWNFLRSWNRIVDEARIQDLAFGAVCKLLIDCASDAVSNASMDLAINYRGIHDVPAIIHYGKPLYFNDSRLLIDEELAKMSPTSKRQSLQSEIRRRFNCPHSFHQHFKTQ